MKTDRSLSKRLADAKKSGVYRVPDALAIREVLGQQGKAPAEVPLAQGKEALLSAIAASLDFPEWFGGNWDALEDCLTDLSWRPHSGQVIVFTGETGKDELGILIDVLRSASESWRDRGRPFFAVFVDPGAKLTLPELHKP